MARFMGILHGRKNAVTRLGTAPSGLRVEANGWNCGVRVVASVDEHNHEHYHIYMTGGSNGASVSKLIATIREEDHGLFDLNV